MKRIVISTPRGDIHGQAAGPEDGPVVVGIHGWSKRNGSHTWAPLVEPLGTAGFRTIAVAMPGWGDSPAWSKTAGKSAVVAILDSLGVETAHALMGKSWGGGVSLDFALTYPSRVNKLILTAPAFRGDVDDLARLSQPVLLAWAKNDRAIPYPIGEKLAEEMPNCQFELYSDGEHEAAQYNVADFAPKAVDFLNN
ncbi:MAG: alpha/beta fold hydrolase [Chloroflexota bacterium]